MASVLRIASRCEPLVQSDPVRADLSSGQMAQVARIEHDIEGRRCLVVDDVPLAKLDLDAGLVGTRPGGGEGGRNEVDRDDGEASLAGAAVIVVSPRLSG